LPNGNESDWRSVIGRLVLIDDSARARHSNTTIVYTLFPHVAQTLRNIQNSLGGRPANTQIQLRRVLEYFSPGTLASIRHHLEQHLAFLEEQNILKASVEQIRVEEWQHQSLLDYLSLAKLRRLVIFFETMAGADEVARINQGEVLRRQVAKDWMRYFYPALSTESYQATVVPGGGRGTLTLVGDFHRLQVKLAVERFRRDDLPLCRQRLQALKQGLKIPHTSTDEIQAAIKQSQLRALSPTQWKEKEDDASLVDYLARSTLYRVADTASQLTKKTRQGLDRAAFGNVTGTAAAFLKRAFSEAGLGALHGHLEDRVGEKVGHYERKVRDTLTPIQEWIGTAQRTIDAIKGELDPIAVSEVEAVLELVEQGHFYPTLILPKLSWSYHDVFPEKSYPLNCVMRVPLNERHEMDPLALLERLEELRYLFRRFPELFTLYCQSMLLVINSPHNPTGVYYRRETILKLLKIASEYGIRLVDDNSYHKLVFSWQKAREGDCSVTETYEKYRTHFTQPVRLITAAATTKGLQGAGDRTGFICANEPGVVEFAEARASSPHQLSLFLTRAKLETGLAAKRYTREVQRIAGQLVDPTSSEAPWEELKRLLDELLPQLKDNAFPAVVFETLLDGYEELLRIRYRGATRRHFEECLSRIVSRLKQIRLERRLRSDVEQRMQQVKMALLRALPTHKTIEPQGAFYYCVRLCEPNDTRGLQEFLCALSRHRKIDLTYAGDGFVRISLGGRLEGTGKSYDKLGLVVETYLRLMNHYWQLYQEHSRNPASLEKILSQPDKDFLQTVIDDLQPLLALHPLKERKAKGLVIAPSERGVVYCIEEGVSVADKVFIEAAGCESLEVMLRSRAFRVLYRRLLKTIYHKNPQLSEVPFAQLENQFGPLACLEAYLDRQLIDDDFRQILIQLYRAWHSQSTVKVLAMRLNADRQSEKVAALHGLNKQINELIHELMYAFAIGEQEVTARNSFEVAFEQLKGIKANRQIPPYLQLILESCAFAGTTAAPNPTPTFLTGATKRVSDYRYGFIRRDGPTTGNHACPGYEYFRQRLAHFAEHFDPAHYLCKAVQVGPFKMLLVIHKSYFHLICEEFRLFPQLESIQNRRSLDDLEWEGVLLFGLPAKVMGDSYRTGYIIDQKKNGAALPTAWVAREDETDYTGFFKKSLLTLHNEQVKAMGGMPVHGAMITITFVNGLRKTLVFSADSGTGKSETITAMMEEATRGTGIGTEVQKIDILAGDMLSLWQGEDGQVYAFGTETGDFLRLNDITTSWQERFGDLLKWGSYSNPDHPSNPRVTIPAICDRRKVLSPTRVNCFFYINNYETIRGNSVELSDDPHHVLKSILVRGLRMNKGTSGDQPNLRAGLEFAGRADLITRYRHSMDELLEWQTRPIGSKNLTCLVYRDGAHDVYAAREIVSSAFKDQKFVDDKKQQLTILAVEHDLMQNLFWLICEGRKRLVLHRGIYDQIYEPLVGTFCGNPFVDPEGMDLTLGRFADTLRKAKVHTGTVRTQLARSGHEFSGPSRAARDVITFLMEDEEVNARFQRNKEKVSAAMQIYYGGVLPPGGNLPVALEGYNLLLLEEYESKHVRFIDAEEHPFTIGTPFYRYTAPTVRGSFIPAIALSEMLATIADICSNPDHDLDLASLEVDLNDYASIRHWNDLDELTYQVLLLNGVIYLGSSPSEVARFPGEVRKARHVAERISESRLKEQVA
jgi:hypothetical protein